MDFDATRVVIDLDAISDNIDAIREKAGVPVMAVIKADAYGHGAVQVARLLKDKCAFFCVSSILEALELRDAGLTTPILILGFGWGLEAVWTAMALDLTARGILCALRWRGGRWERSAGFRIQEAEG